MTIRVLIADDHRIVREGLRLVLSSYPDLAVVGEAVDGHDALAQVARLNPDVLLLDIFMPVLDGVAVARRMQAEHPGVRVVVLTMDNDTNDVRRLIEADIAGFVMKDAPSSEVVRAIRAARRGEVMLDETVARTLLNEYQRARRGTSPQSMFDLTEREQQILCRLTVGESNKEIARALDLAEKTVRNHLHNIFGKMSVTDRTQAVILALRYGLCEDNAATTVGRHGDNRFNGQG
jgi:DNA-binding NarL/FixJ family response regulator